MVDKKKKGGMTKSKMQDARPRIRSESLEPSQLASVCVCLAEMLLPVPSAAGRDGIVCVWVRIFTPATRHVTTLSPSLKPSPRHCHSALRVLPGRAAPAAGPARGCWEVTWRNTASPARSARGGVSGADSDSTVHHFVLA